VDADPSEHVRRLVSEGTRPRLPWASRLPAFQRDPAPVLALLERLKDDPALYVRRSVANNLNDIGKDHPALLADTARAWLQDATQSGAGSCSTRCARPSNGANPAHWRRWALARRPTWLSASQRHAATRSHWRHAGGGL
jgi:HEAT repeat protein